MNAVDIVMQMINAMSVDEKRRVIIELGKDADVQAMQGEVAKPTPTKGGGRSGKRGSRPFWIKSAHRIDDTKKGMFRIEGDWVQDPADVANGTLVIVGAKEPKHYILGRVNPSEQVTFESLGKTRVVEGVEQIARGDRFGDIESAVASAL